MGLDDIDYRTKVGSDAWKARHNEDERRLSAWRRLHKLLDHEEVIKVARYDMTSDEMLAVISKILANNET